VCWHVKFGALCVITHFASCWALLFRQCPQECAPHYYITHYKSTDNHWLIINPQSLI
jgi:hypothetical protein